jgi:hypothetical protein
MPQSQRQKFLEKLHGYFDRERMPRLAMLIVLLFTSSAGFLASRGLLSAGVTSMPVRYLLASLIGWMAFTFVIRIWVAIELKRVDPNVVVSGAQRKESKDQPFENAMDVSIRALDSASNNASLDSEEFGCLWVISIGLIVFVFTATIGSVFTIIATAPALIAEAFVDVIAAGVLARKLKFHDAQWWAFGVIRRTWTAALGIAVILALAGFAMQRSKEGVQSISEFFAR